MSWIDFLHSGSLVDLRKVESVFTLEAIIRRSFGKTAAAENIGWSTDQRVEVLSTNLLDWQIVLLNSRF